jgi:hypothetical protein
MAIRTGKTLKLSAQSAAKLGSRQVATLQSRGIQIQLKSAPTQGAPSISRPMPAVTAVNTARQMTGKPPLSVPSAPKPSPAPSTPSRTSPAPVRRTITEPRPPVVQPPPPPPAPPAPMPVEIPPEVPPTPTPTVPEMPTLTAIPNMVDVLDIRGHILSIRQELYNPSEHVLLSDVEQLVGTENMVDFIQLSPEERLLALLIIASFIGLI